jgi:uncharacterized protein (DUF433 family)
VTTTIKKLGSGVYSLADASRLTGKPVATLRSWFRGRSDQKGFGPAFQSDYDPIDGDYAISFLDLIDALVATKFRAAGVSMSEIRRAYNTLVTELKTRHPFAYQDLYTDGEKVIHKTQSAELVAVVSKQQWFKEFIDCLSRIDYRSDIRLAQRWRISDGVVLDPEVRFGKPVIERTSVPTYILARQFYANGENADVIAGLFGVSASQVAAAVAFEKQHGYLMAS